MGMGTDVFCVRRRRQPLQDVFPSDFHVFSDKFFSIGYTEVDRQALLALLRQLLRMRT